MGDQNKENIKIPKYSENLVFSKYAGNLVGGAEISLEKMIDKGIFGPKKTCSYLFFKSVSSFGYLPSTQVRVIYSDLKLFDFTKFKYVEYLLNHKRISKHLKKYNSGFITYGYWSAYLSRLNTSKELTLLLRSTQGFGISPNPYSGIKRVLYFIYRLMEYPVFLYWSRDFNRMLKLKPKIIANSNFIAEKFYSKWGIRVDRVEYPDVSLPNLEKYSPGESNFVLFVGDNEHKGLSIFKYLVRNLPNHKFVCYARSSSVEKVVGNITFKPWSSSFTKDLIQCKLLVVPSQWEEAYGRVSREKFLAGGGVLVSNVGGLPETVDHQSRMLVNNYRSKKEWLRRVKSYLESH